MLCLNCNHPIQLNYCEFCGQRAATHRFSFNQHFFHDFVHGVFHLDKGLLFTLKELFIRPGHTVREYIAGKRTSHFNFFSFYLLALTSITFLRHLSGVQIDNLFHTHVSQEIITLNKELIGRFGKFMAVFSIPIFTVINYFLFRKSNQNLAEHLVINLYKSGATFCIMAIFHVLGLVFPHHTDLKHFYVFISLAQFFYEFIFCYQYFSVFGYSKISLFIRAFLGCLFMGALIVNKWLLFI